MKRKQTEKEEPPSKRPRLIGYMKQGGSGTSAITFDDLNKDCLVHILSYLEIDEMNDATLINNAIKEARNNPSLDQTRTAKITISEDMDVADLLDIMEDKRWTRFFSEGSNHKCLKIVGAEILSADYENHSRLVQNPGGLQFQSVTILDVSQSSKHLSQRVDYYVIEFLSHLFPNLQQVDWSYVETDNDFVMMLITHYHPNLKCIKFNGGFDEFHVSPTYVRSAKVKKLVEMQFDSALLVGCPRVAYYSDLSETESYLFMQYQSLERVSMKNATWRIEFSNAATPVPQNILIKLVRYHPTLRWLRSDLTDENIAMLKKERPEVMLINE